MKNAVIHTQERVMHMAVKLFSFIVMGIMAVAAAGVALYYRDSSLRHALAAMQNQLSHQKPTIQHVEKVVARSQPWGAVQRRVKDTVVQVFAQVANHDLLQPYATPRQGQGAGSGFFINSDGDIITNAHVVDQAISVWIQVPSLGKTLLDVEVIGAAPERDVALLRLTDETKKLLDDAFGSIAYLELGDSDSVSRSDELLALGYPLGQQSLKSTTGIVSGREHVGGQFFIQMSAPINPGSSGGPSLNVQGDVIGINTASIDGSQNANYIIPINDVKLILGDLRQHKLLRRPYLGIQFNNATPALTQYWGNPQPGGAYIVTVVDGSPMAKAGAQAGDMIYEVDGHAVDQFGEITVPWSEDKISITDYFGRLRIGDKVTFVLYRHGVKTNIAVDVVGATDSKIKHVYPGYEELPYEIVGGMVIQPLTLNLLPILAKAEPTLTRYSDLRKQQEPALVITHIHHDSLAHRSRAIGVGYMPHKVNGKKVTTLDELRAAVGEGKQSGFITIETPERLVIAFPYRQCVQEEARLSKRLMYPLTPFMQHLFDELEVERKQGGVIAAGRAHEKTA